MKIKIGKLLNEEQKEALVLTGIRMCAYVPCVIAGYVITNRHMEKIRNDDEVRNNEEWNSINEQILKTEKLLKK